MKHVLIINPNRDTFSNPTLDAILKEMCRIKKIKISIVCPDQEIELSYQSSIFQIIKMSKLSVNWSKNIGSWIPKVLFLVKLLVFCKKYKVDRIIGVDPIGLIYAGRLKRLYRKASLHYFSFEIFFLEEVTHLPYFLKIKKKEKIYSKYINSLLIQDKKRLELLCTENNLNSKKVNYFLIPVYPNYDKDDSDFKKVWRKKLSIPESTIVFMHSGSLDKWSGGNWLVKLVENGLNNNQLILIHTKTKLDEHNEIHSKLMELEKNGSHVKIHTSPFSNYKEYLSFIQLSDFGLAFYEIDKNNPYTGKNIEEIGLASGKFSCYLHQEVPIITSFSEFYAQLNESYQFGYVLKSPEEFKDIHFEKSQSFKENLKKLVSDKYKVDKLVKEYIHFLDR